MNKGGIHDYCQNSLLPGVLAKILSTKLVKIAVEGLKPQVQTRPIWISVICPYRSMCGLEAGGCQSPQAQGPDESASGIPHCLPRIQQFDHPTEKMRSIGHRVLNP